MVFGLFGTLNNKKSYFKKKWAMCMKIIMEIIETLLTKFNVFIGIRCCSEAGIKSKCRKRAPNLNLVVTL